MNIVARLAHVGKTYIKRRFLFARPAKKTVLQDISLELTENKVLGLVGESGCGKTTLSKILLGLEAPTSGTVEVNGQDVQKASSSQLKQLRRFMQVVFQDPYSSLDPRFTARQSICEAWDIHGLYKNTQERQKKLEELMAAVGLSSAHLERYPHEFSGGQRQRVAIARALALDPKLLVADEPVSALDVSVQAQILNLLKEIKNRRSLAVLFVTHDFAVARFLCDEIAVMYKGRIVERAPGEELFSNVQHPYTEMLFSAVPQPNSNGKEPMAAVANAGAENSPCPFAPRCAYYKAAECNRPFALEEVRPGHFCACAKLPFKTQKSAFSI